MTAKIINGKEIAAKFQVELQKKIDERVKQGLRRPELAVILVGADPASEVYVHNKRAACEQSGIVSLDYDLPSTTSQEELLKLIDDLNNNPRIDGILVQLPLPSQINANLILEKIRPDKDIDGFHPYNLGRLAQKRPQLRSCTPYGIMALLEFYGIELSGLDAVIVGASNIVGRPMALELLNAGATVTICHRATKNLSEKVKAADLLVVAIGNTDVIKSEWIKIGAIVIDVGIHRMPNGKLRGDIDFETAKERASWITPVPGGVGPMTVQMLLQNTLLAASELHKS